MSNCSDDEKGATLTAAINMQSTFPHGLYIMPGIDNSIAGLHEWIREKCLVDASRIFCATTYEDVREFCEMAGIPEAGASPAVISKSIQYYVQRLKNYAHVEAMHHARVEVADVEPFPDQCPVVEKHRVDIEAAMAEIERYRQMSHETYFVEVYGRDHGFPPFNLDCMCTMRALPTGVANLAV